MSISGVIRKEKFQNEELRQNQSNLANSLNYLSVSTRKPVSPPKQNRRPQKKEENLKTRSGRRVKVPQLDGNADSSDESTSRSGMEVDLPQTDGANDAPRQQLPQMYHQIPPAQRQHNGNTHSSPTVIPILMPPGNW